MKESLYMDNQQIPGHSGIGAAMGSLCSIVLHLLQTNWTEWATQASLEIIKVIVVGIIGGAAGVIGTQLMKKVLKSPRLKKILKFFHHKKIKQTRL